MVEKVSFHKNSRKLEEYAERSIASKIALGDLTEKDAELIREFVAVQRVQNGCGDLRANKITNTLTNLSRFCKTPYTECSIADIYTAVTKIKSGMAVKSKIYKCKPASIPAGAEVQEFVKNGETYVAVRYESDKPLAPDSKRDFITFLKRFFLWMNEEGYTNLPADKIRKIKPPAGKTSGHTAEEMLTEAEIIQLIEKGCRGETAVRDRALIALTYEAGLRIHEISKLRWGDLQFDKHFIRLNVTGKTDKPRYIPLTSCRTYLSEWRAAYPAGIPEGDAPVFVTSSVEDDKMIYRTFTYAYLRNHINNLLLNIYYIIHLRNPNPPLVFPKRSISP